MPRKRGTAIAGPDNDCVISPPSQNSYPAKIVERSPRGPHCAPFFLRAMGWRRPRLRWIIQRCRREVRSLFAIFLFTFFFIFTSLAFASPLQNGQPTATVEGVVTSATNGRMLPHARVYLRSSLAKDNFVTWADSDDEGHFLFKALEEGTYEVSAEKPGFYVDERKGPVHLPVEVGRGENHF